MPLVVNDFGKISVAMLDIEHGLAFKKNGVSTQLITVTGVIFIPSDINVQEFRDNIESIMHHAPIDHLLDDHATQNCNFATVTLTKYKNMELTKIRYICAGKNKINNYAAAFIWTICPIQDILLFINNDVVYGTANNMLLASSIVFDPHNTIINAEYAEHMMIRSHIFRPFMIEDLTICANIITSSHRISYGTTYGGLTYTLMNVYNGDEVYKHNRYTRAFDQKPDNIKVTNYNNIMLLSQNCLICNSPLYDTFYINIKTNRGFCSTCAQARLIYDKDYHKYLSSMTGTSPIMSANISDIRQVKHPTNNLLNLLVKNVKLQIPAHFLEKSQQNCGEMTEKIFSELINTLPVTSFGMHVYVWPSVILINKMADTFTRYSNLLANNLLDRPILLADIVYSVAGGLPPQTPTS